MEFRLLGDLQVWHDGSRIDLGGRRQQCVLAVLLLHPGQLVSTEKIIACAWPTDPPLTAPNLVTSYISRLRRILEPAGDIKLTSRPPGYLADVDPDLIDTHRFSLLVHRARTDLAGAESELAAARLREALALCRGIPLTGLDSPWLRDRGWALEAIRLDVLEELARVDLAADRPRDVIALLREPHAAHPERERLAGLLIRALHAAGEPAQAAQAAERAIRSVRELGLDPGPLLRQAHHDTLTDRAVPLTAMTREPRHQLPSASSAFTGRTEELRYLTDLAETTSRNLSDGAGVRTGTGTGTGSGSGTVAVCVIDGMGGVGKTAVALRAAHRVAGDFPDGRLFLDLRGHTPGLEPLTALEALDWLLRSLGIAPALIPPDLDGRAAFYRDRLADTRTLIVLDNAANAAQVRPLLPGAGECLVLITSRHQLPGLDDAYVLSLDVLPPVDAIALLRTIAGPGRVAPNDPYAAEITALCGHLPLAVRIAAARLRHRRALTTRDLAAGLRAEYRRLAGLDDGERSIAAVFDLSYWHLPAAEQHMFRRLGLVPGPDFDAFAAANLTGTDYDVTGGLLDSLVGHNLLLQPSAGRYRLHDLVRIHARSLNRADLAESRAAATDRLLDFYQYTASNADARIARHGRPEPTGPQPTYAPYLTEPDQARAWLRTERANLIACIDIAVAEGWDERVVALAGGLATLLCADGPLPLALALHATALTAAQRLGDRRSQADALTDLGAVRRLTGDLAGAARDLETALELVREPGDQSTRSIALIEFGTVRLECGEHSEAAQIFKEALGLCRELDDRRGQAFALTQLGTTRYLTGDLSAGTRDLTEALDLSRDLGHSLNQARALTHLGIVRRFAGDYADAAKYLEEALELSRGIGDRRNEAEVLNALGNIRLLTGDRVGAKRDLEKQLAISRRIGHLNGQGSALAGLGRVHRQAGELDAAVRCTGQALAIFRWIGAQVNVAFALNHYGAIYLDYGDLSRAMAVYRESLRLAREVRQPDDEALALEGMGSCFASDGAIDEGVAHLAEAREIFRRLGMRPDSERVEAALAKLGAA